MTTCRDIVTRALQMSGIVALGRDPKAAETEAGMVSLQSLYDEWFTGGMFGRLKDVYADGIYTANEGERITADGATITLPTLYDDNKRPPYEFSAVVIVTGGTADNFVYHNGAWHNCAGLLLGDDAPLASISVDGLAGCVAERLVSTFGGDVSVGSARAARQFKQALSLKIGATQPAATSVYF
ncbi:hypothetical protein UFOVP319_40 [uncultured Caudovirales phage]|uniref:Uncharacterized protein n=1 Tax=uncultured Caudovirales phage TaxID=2100421 RepID=A0A6J5LT10_9CAUD|nr:hypothetical protein UFOVP319_40 [uncultured Caudovirales phage]